MALSLAVRAVKLIVSVTLMPKLGSGGKVVRTPWIGSLELKEVLVLIKDCALIVVGLDVRIEGVHRSGSWDIGGRCGRRRG